MYFFREGLPYPGSQTGENLFMGARTCVLKMLTMYPGRKKEIPQTLFITFKVNILLKDAQQSTGSTNFLLQALCDPSILHWLEG